jgi:pimeloyl-ACP methyl ester carboxylesterase
MSRLLFLPAVGVLVLGATALLATQLDPASLSPAFVPPTAPETRFLPVEGGTIAYDDAGEGPVVICLPSMGDVRAEYRFLRPQLLAAGFRVVTMDLRGQGESSVGFTDYSAPAIGSDILALARHLNAGPVAVAGTSIAGGSAAWVAAEAPDQISRLVLVGAFVRDHPQNPLLLPTLKLLLSGPWGPTFWTQYFSNFYPSHTPADFDAYRAQLTANLAQPGRMAAVRGMADRSDAPVEARLARVRAPTLVVMGSRDPDFDDPAAEAGWIADQLHGRVLMVERAGHYPHAEMPDQVGPEIVRFLSDTNRGDVPQD